MMRDRRIAALLCAAALCVSSAIAAARGTPPLSKSGVALRDGSHDFDFSLGTWKEHSSRLLHPLNFATSNVGRLGDVPGVGEFKNGRIDFYDQEPLNGREILVRFSVWRVSTTMQQTEQAYSDDGGKTWEVNWVNRYTRVGS